MPAHGSRAPIRGLDNSTLLPLEAISACHIASAGAQHKRRFGLPYMIADRRNHILYVHWLIFPFPEFNETPWQF
jgi:hypothetical protein